jgi:hypothetical protein
MKGFINLRNTTNNQISRENRIERDLSLLSGKPPTNIRVYNLTRSVHSLVCPPGSMDPNSLTCQASKRCF